MALFSVMQRFTADGLPNTELSILISMLFVLAYGFVASKKQRSNLPPGPKPLPIIGNVHQMLNERPIDVVQKWHQKYGPMVAFHYGQQLAISIGSRDIAHDLMSKRGAIYNSRPRFIIPCERMTGGLNLAVMPYGKRWQNHHRIMSSMLDTTASNGYHGVHDLETKQSLHELLASNDFESIIRRYCASTVMTLSYGIRVEDIESTIPNSLLDLNEQPLNAIGNSYYSIVELFPILDHLPGFLAPWKGFSAGVKRQTTAFHMKHLELGQTSPTWNWVQESLLSKAGSQVSPEELAWVIGTITQAGVEAVITVMRLMIKVMVLYPLCLEKAQRELDQVVGLDRLPSSSDIPHLPYARAILDEAMRWQPPTPFAIPHATTEDNEYMGYHIPKGTVIIPNTWVISGNPEVFPDPHEFRPERWIENPSLQHNPFGFGRRICPGRHLGWDIIFVFMVRIMWAYNVTHAYEDGKRVNIDPWDLKVAFTAATQPFRATFHVRSPKKQEIIEKEWETVDKDVGLILEDIRAKRAQ